MSAQPKGKLELLVSELMAVNAALQQAENDPAEWYRLMTRHRSLRSQVMAMDEPVYPGGE